MNKHFKLPLPLTDIEASSAEYLSRPLYVLYINTLAAKEAKRKEFFFPKSTFKLGIFYFLETEFSIEINGNVEEAKEIQFNHCIEGSVSSCKQFCFTSS